MPDNNRKNKNARSKELWRESTSLNNVTNFYNENMIYLFRDDNDNIYASINRDDGKIICSIDSEDFKDNLRTLVSIKTGKELVNMKNYIAACRHLAHNMPSNRHSLAVRVAKASSDDDGNTFSIFIAFDKLNIIEVKPGSWSILRGDDYIVFKSFPHQRPMRMPNKEEGDPTKIFDFVNIHKPTEKAILLSYLIAGLIPDIVMPALVLNGPPGSAKTTLLRLMKKLLDPSIPETINDNRSMDEISLIASQNRMLVFDNLTYLTGRQSDMLCSIITGVGFSKRRLFTDENLVVQEYRNLVALSGVRLVPDRADLFDRSIILSLQSIDPEEIRYEEDIWREFDKSAGVIFGGMLNTLAEALIIAKRVKLYYKPRLADFARYSVAIMHALGWDPQLIMDALVENKRKQIEAVIEASPIGSLLLKFLKNKESWIGLASELNAELQKIASEDGANFNYKYWPHSDKALAQELVFLSNALKEYGILFESKRVSAGSQKGFKKIPGGLMHEPEGKLDTKLYEIEPE